MWDVGCETRDVGRKIWDIGHGTYDVGLETHESLDILKTHEIPETIQRQKL